MAKLIVSSPMMEYNGMWNAFIDILKTDISGFYLTDYRDLPMFWSWRVPHDKMLIVDSEKSYWPISNKENVYLGIFSQETDIFIDTIVRSLRKGGNLIPVVASMEQARALVRTVKIPPFRYIDVGPFGNNSRAAICGEGFGMNTGARIYDFLRDKYGDIQLGAQGGLRIPEDSKDNELTIDRLIALRPDFITVGRRISGYMDKETRNRQIARYLAEAGNV